jgi:flagellar protein FlaI
MNEKAYPYSKYSPVSIELSKEDSELAYAIQALATHKVPVDKFCLETGCDKEKASKVVSFVESVGEGLPLNPVDKTQFLKLCKELLSGNEANKTAIALGAYSRLFGLPTVSPLFEDEDIEEVIIQGVKKPVFVYHRTLGACETPLSFNEERKLEEMLVRLGSTGGKDFFDAKLRDGSRVNVAFPPVAEEPTITIRRFKENPVSITQIIAQGTLTSELAAFLWACVDGLLLYPLNVVIAGGTASGKTTLLNALASFIPPHERILTIEDTQELNFFGRKNWLALKTSEKSDLDALLKNTLRMRPDRILVGEVRGAEAETLFTAMNVGHRGSMATIHANSGREAVKRLENPPMNVPRALIPAIDVMVVVHRTFDRRKGFVRRVTEVSELSRIEDQVALNPVFEWDSENDFVKRTSASMESKEKLAAACNLKIAEVTEAIDEKKRVLNYLLEKRLTGASEVNAFMQKYYEEYIS